MCRINSVCFISPESDKNKTAQIQILDLNESQIHVYVHKLIEKEIVKAVWIWLCVPISFTST